MPTYPDSNVGPPILLDERGAAAALAAAQDNMLLTATKTTGLATAATTETVW